MASEAAKGSFPDEGEVAEATCAMEPGSPATAAIAEGAERPEARVGAVICTGKWRLDELLGVGGMAAVYAATHRTGRRAALKILHRELSRDAQIRDRFLREGYVGNKVQHAGRVQVWDNDVTDEGELFLVMELLLGETLDARWKRFGRKMPIDEALSIAERLLDVLHACHSVEIIHRDLKPANIFLTDDGQLKVLDFGVARLRDATAEATRTGTALGTPAFMSPEQARGLGDDLDGRADIFSVGALIYALVSGTRLHKGRSNDEALVQAATQPASSLARVAPDAPIEVVALVDKALAWDRRSRFSNAREMQAEVARVAKLVGGDMPGTGERATQGGDAIVDDVEAPLADDDPLVVELRGVFRAIERYATTVRQYGAGHPELARRLAGAHAAIDAVTSRSRRPLRWAVRPYAFVRGGREVWEPTAPLDGVPYALFDAGIRRFALAPGLSEDELATLVDLWLRAPRGELAPEDDVATVLWELGLSTIEVESVDALAEGDAAQRSAFFIETDAIEEVAAVAARASRAEARAMPMVVETSGPHTGVRAWLATVLLDPTARKALATQLQLPADRWMERFADGFFDAIVAARARGQASSMIAALRRSAVDLVRRGEGGVLVGLLGALSKITEVRLPLAEREAFARVLATALVGGEVLVTTLESSGDENAPAWRDALLRDGLAQAGPDEALAIVDALGLLSSQLRPLAVEAIERALPTHGAAIAERVASLAPETAMPIVAALGARPSAGGAVVLDALGRHPDASVRVAATLARAGSADQRRADLSRLLEVEQEEGRRAVLDAIAKTGMRELVPAVARRIDDAAFHGLSLDERRALLSTLSALHPGRAETAAISILGQRAVIRSDGRDGSRALAVDWLAAHGRSREAVDALAALVKGWWGISDDLRARAVEASRVVATRVADEGTPPR